MRTTTSASLFTLTLLVVGVIALLLPSALAYFAGLRQRRHSIARFSPFVGALLCFAVASLGVRLAGSPQRLLGVTVVVSLLAYVLGRWFGATAAVHAAQQRQHE